MAKIIHAATRNGALLEKAETRDCWLCVHIPEAMGNAMPQVCKECIWNGISGPGLYFNGEWARPTHDNFVARRAGRWGG